MGVTTVGRLVVTLGIATEAGSNIKASPRGTGWLLAWAGPLARPPPEYSRIPT